jgi:hypothetical protein
LAERRRDGVGAIGSDAPLHSLRPDDVVADQVHGGRIAPDLNNRRGYGGSVADSAVPDSGSDAGDAEEIVDAEIVPDPLPVTPQDTGYTPGGVPTFDAVREKIETRYGTAIGSSELASETSEGRQVEEQYEARQRAAHDRLDQIRASMRDEPDKT